MELLILEAGDRSMRVTRFRAKAKLVTFVAMDRYPLTDEAGVESLAETLARDAEPGSTIVLSIPPADLACREIEHPLRDRRKVREILPLELKGETASETREAVFDALPLDAGKYLAVWGNRARISGYLASLTRAGLEPRIVSSAPLHWQSLLPEGADGCVALSDGTALFVFRNRTPVSFRALCGEGFPGEIGKTLAALEVRTGIRVESLYLFGDAAQRGTSTLHAAAPAGAPASLLPVAGSLGDAFAGNSAAALLSAGAWALAREVVTGDPVNFRHGDLAYTAGRERALKKLRVTALLAVLALLLLFSETGVRYLLARNELNSLNRSITGIYREVFPTRTKAVDEVAELKAELKKTGGDAGTHAVLPLMKKLAEAMGEGIGGFYETEFEGNLVRLKGEAESFQAVNEFRARVEGLFTEVEAGEIKSKPGGGVTFSLRGAIREAGR